MKSIILAGGLGTRLQEETATRPKPMIEIGEQPILWHIMKSYASYGLKDFIVALGYKGEIIKEYFLNYYYLSHDFSICMANGKVDLHAENEEDWSVHLVNTGLKTQTGGRIKRLSHWVRNETFTVTYGDGVSNVNLQELLAFHKAHGKLATITAVRPPSRFGGLSFEGDLVNKFIEKPQIGEGWISGGFFVLEPEVLDYIEGDDTLFEKEPLERLAEDGQLVAYRHGDFWQCMDTLRDMRLLESLWQSGQAPWKSWK